MKLSVAKLDIMIVALQVKVKNVTGCRSNIVAIFFVVIVIEDSNK